MSSADAVTGRAPTNRETARTEHTYKVIRLVATSSVSWEDAAQRAVAEACKTIQNLGFARVMEMDTVLRDGQVAKYRVKLEIAFQIDRARPSEIEGEPDVQVKRYLIVANETLAGELVPALVADRVKAGPSEFHILVPSSPSRDTQRLRALVGDPVSGYSSVDLVGLQEAQAQDRERAVERLDTFIDRLSDFRAMITSEIGRPDPFAAITQVMGRSSFDEIIISTAQPGVSRWLKLDLPSRVQRSFPIPVVVVHPPT
ncbi:MAG: dodecin domain-containing protein [Actinomycetota bacterium]|nr:dodecin domain-containing protein [Actinomycetota bacterium]